MSQEEDPQQVEPTPGGRISRDTLLLVGALSFLILAVALTFLFVPGSPPPSTEPTQAAEAPNPTLPGADAYPSPEPATPIPAPDPYPNPIIPTEPLPGETFESYPSPEQATPEGFPEGQPEPTPEGEAEPTPDPNLVGTTDPAYPGPEGIGTPPAPPPLQPTVIVPPVPTVVVPTPMPPVAQPPTPIPPPPPPPPPIQPPLEPTVPPPPTAIPEPTPIPPPPVDVLRGSVRWGLAQSPILVKRDIQLAPGAELIIEPGVEVRLDLGVAIYVDGARLLALGLPDRPVRFVGATGVRWNGLFGRPGSFIVLEHTEVRGGGAGGTVMAVERSELVVRSSRFNDNGGAILLDDTRLEMRDSEVAANDMPFGPALEASYGRGNFITLSNNRFGGNRLADGAPQVRVSNRSTFETLNLTIDGNLIRGGAPNLQLTTDGPLNGAVTCNSLIGDAQGFGLRTQTPQVAPNGLPPLALRVERNYIDEHVPPIIPVYLRFGLGRGATSEVLLDMRNNWWGDPSGPYEPDQNADGRGDSVGANIRFAPWLSEPPPCAPPR
ncbi:MAG: hypothetical protein AB4911_14245 [Oscillochloridaceae bacterium umkhey_bin13]